jgi:predicted nucleotidyltransferase
MLLNKLNKQGLISPPKWLIANSQYLTVMGSDAYGVSSGSSDVDIYGFCVPPRYMVFPHLAGEVLGFGRQAQRFEQWQEHHVLANEKMYDFSIYGIVKYFDLCMENNPNMIDSLFTPRRCVIHSTQIGEHVRQHRRLFLHKGAWHKFKGYAYAQMSKIANKVNASNPKRAESIEQFGYDVKFAYHVVRLLNQVEQIMVEGDLDLERNREQLKAIRRGEWSIEQLHEYFTTKEKALEETYAASKLPHGPDEERIKAILLECLELHYGNLDTAIARNPSFDRLLDDLRALLDRYQMATCGGAAN